MRMAWFAAPVIGLAAGVGAMAWSSQSDTGSTDAEVYRQLDLFSEVIQKVREDYVTPLDSEKAVAAAINGMLASLDPHSSYLTPQEYRDMNTQTRGVYGGLGIEVTTEDGVVKVISPMDETPASRAGVQSGDYITHLNDESIIGLTLNEAVQRMRGPVGTTITLTLAREGQDPQDVTLTREMINVRAVTARVEDGIGVLRISTFNERTASMLEEGVRQIRRDAGGSLKGVVLDLRNNAGGLLDQSIKVADAFLENGEIVSTRGRVRGSQSRATASKGDILAGVPLVVLINGGSASASEIVAGALQDHDRALVVGMTSFGKGSVQTIMAMRGGRDGALRMTTALYYTPEGRSIQNAGIEPDLEIAQARRDKSSVARRLGISEADLARSLPNATGAKRRGPHDPEEQPPEGWDSAKDFQLTRAKELLSQGVVAERLRARSAEGAPAQTGGPG
jgi:carboxyl-terminal processing protease